MRKILRTALVSVLLATLVAACGAAASEPVGSRPSVPSEIIGSPSRAAAPDPSASSLDVPVDPPPTLPHYPADLTPEEIAAIEAGEARIDALEAARPPDTGPLYAIVEYVHHTETLAEAVGLAEVILVGTVTGTEWGAWREVAGRPERDRFLLVEAEQTVHGDVEQGTTIRLRQLGETVVRGVLRERREGAGAVRLDVGDRALLLLAFDPRTESYSKLNLDGVQRLRDGRVEGSERTTRLSRTVEQLTEAQLLHEVEAAVRSRQSD